MYYLRTKPATQAIQFTVDQSAMKPAIPSKQSRINNNDSSTLPSSLNRFKNNSNETDTDPDGGDRGSGRGGLAPLPLPVIYGEVCTSCSG